MVLFRKYREGNTFKRESGLRVFPRELRIEVDMQGDPKMKCPIKEVFTQS